MKRTFFDFSQNNTQSVSPKVANVLRRASADGSLDLQSTSFETAAEVVELLSSLPANVSKLKIGQSLSNLNLNQDEARLIFQSLPESVVHLSLRDCKTPCLLQAIPHVPATVSHLDLACNNLSNYYPHNFEMLKEALSKLQVGSLDLSANFYNKRIPSPQLGNMFKNISSSVTSLDLSLNFITYTGTACLVSDILKISDMEIIFDGIPKNILELKLNGNFYNLHCEAEGLPLTTAFEKLPRSLYSLDLSDIALCEFGAEKVAAAFTRLPASLKILNLKNIGLVKLTINELKTVFEAVPATVENIDLTDNFNYSRESFQNLIEALNALPKRTAITCLDGGRGQLSILLKQVRTQSYRILAKRLPYEIANEALSFFTGAKRNLSNQTIQPGEEPIEPALLQKCILR